MKIFSNIKWMLFNAPTAITCSTEKMYCDYCGESDGGITHYTNAELKICQHCLKKALDCALLKVDSDAETA